MVSTEPLNEKDAEGDISVVDDGGEANRLMGDVPGLQ